MTRGAQRQCLQQLSPRSTETFSTLLYPLGTSLGVPKIADSYIYFISIYNKITNRIAGGNFHLKVGGAKSSGNAGDPMLGVAVIP